MFVAFSVATQKNPEKMLQSPVCQEEADLGSWDISPAPAFLFLLEDFSSHQVPWGPRKVAD